MAPISQPLRTFTWKRDWDPDKNYYEIMGLDHTATDKDIKLKYYKLAQQYHPDKNEGKEDPAFLEIQFAYKLLADPHKRKWYDQESKLTKEGAIMNDFEKNFVNSSRELRNKWDDKYQNMLKGYKGKKIGDSVQEQERNSDLAKIFMVLGQFNGKL